MRKLFMMFSFLCCTLIAWSQQRTITGKVVDEQSQPIPSASVLIKGVSKGTATNADGAFSIDVTPGAVLIFTGIGFKPQEIKINNQTTLTVKLSPVDDLMEDVVVTGVSQAVSQRKVPFSITKVSTDALNTVPALDVSQSLRAKVAGIQITQTQGDDAATVFLRGAKSMFGNVAPLIIIDGMITNFGLGDLNAQDIENIEVVKGAAASALYGTRSEGGVIHIISKKGRNTKGVSITLDNEVGVNNIQRIPDLATMHNFVPDLANEFGFQLTGQSARIINYKDNGFSLELSPYKNNYDNTRALLDNNTYFSNYVSLATSGDKYNAFFSFKNQETGGVVIPMDPNKKRSLTLRTQFRPTDKIEAEFSFNYFNEVKPSSAVTSNGQGTFFAATLQWEPFIDLTYKNPDGSYPLMPAGAAIQAANLSNPLYEWSKRQYTNNSDDYLGGAKLKYKMLKNLSVELQGSIRKSTTTTSSLYPKGYETQNTSETLNNGNLSLSYSAYQHTNGQVTINHNTKITSDISLSTTARLVYESYFNKGFGVSGFDYSGTAGDIYTIQNTRPDSRSGSGSDMFTSKTVNYGYYLNFQTGWREKVFLDLLARVDQSSRYGANAQDASFPRVALAYRLTEDYYLGALTELKLRYNWGAAGSLPGYNAKNSIANVTANGITETQLENTRLARSITYENEFGFDAVLYNKINVVFNYAFAKSEGDFVRPDPFVKWEGAGVTKNFGVTKSRSLELEVNGNVLNTKNVRWDFGLTFGRVRSEIISLGVGLTPRPNGLFMVDAGLSPFTMWGQTILTSLSELEVDRSTGFVTNASNGAYTLDDFVVNQSGYVVLKNTVGTANELPLLKQKDGANVSEAIGDAQPDFQVGFSNTFTFFKRLSLYAVLDWRQGGQKYDQTTQYLTSAGRSRMWQDYALSGLPMGFVQGLYNGNVYTNVWVSKNSYLALREVSLSYDLPNPAKLKLYKSAKIALVGRNLFTMTKFQGSNPEGSSEYFPYPVYRTYTARLILNL